MTSRLTFLARTLIAFATISAAFSLHSAQAQIAVSGSVGGQIAPGVYGRIDIGSAPPPVVVYPQPVQIVPPPPNVRMIPVYYNVPPGHAKKWHKHCRKYNACGMPVYFVKTPEYQGQYWKEHEGREYEWHGEKHGKGKGKKHHDD